MISIGEFSLSTGLNIKTLRYYHDIGLLPAAEVDEFNGYRKYSSAQFAQAALLRVLRAAGMSITQMKAILTEPDSMAEVLSDRVRELTTQRMLEDWALAAAPTILAGPQQVSVQYRDCAPQPWAGIRTVFDLNAAQADEPVSGLDTVSENLGAAFGALVEELRHSGYLSEADSQAPVWTAMDSSPEKPAVVTITHCIGLERELDPAFGFDSPIAGFSFAHGELPERREAYVSSRTVDEQPDNPQSYLPGGPLPTPEAIAISLVAEEHGIEGAQVRQSVIENSEGPIIELALTLPGPHRA